jgi:hypothetical protein
VEPKTFFANERTFLSWLSIAILLMLLSLSLLNTQSEQALQVSRGASAFDLQQQQQQQQQHNQEQGIALAQQPAEMPSGSPQLAGFLQCGTACSAARVWPLYPITGTEIERCVMADNTPVRVVGFCMRSAYVISGLLHSLGLLSSETLEMCTMVCSS